MAEPASRPDATSKADVRSAIFPFPILLAALALSACGGDVSTAGDYQDTSTAGTFIEAGPGTLFPGLEGAALLDAVDRGYSPDRTLGYGPARDELYGWEQSTYGAVCGVYTEDCLGLGGGDASQAAGQRGINAEHVWPQSRGARAEPLRSDLHHVFPSRESVNSSRGNLPFGEVPDLEADAWYRADQSQSRTPGADIDDWSERGNGRWEPRENRKGDIARAVFYVAAVYPDRAEPGFLDEMLSDLLQWNAEDPPDDRERARSSWVSSLQSTENPFVLDATLAPRIWARGSLSSSTPGPTSRPRDPDPPSRPSTTAPSTTASEVSITEIHYDNAGDDVGEGIEVAGPTGTVLDGWTLVLVNGSRGTVYQTITLEGVLQGPLWVEIPGLQNGSPDGIVLMDPAGRVVEALSYEGSFRAESDPVRGVRLEDIGASEGPNAAPGTSLHRRGGRWVSGPATPGR